MDKALLEARIAQLNQELLTIQAQMFLSFRTLEETVHKLNTLQELKKQDEEKAKAEYAKAHKKVATPKETPDAETE